MAPRVSRTWSRGERAGRGSGKVVTIGDLCRAIEEQRVAVTRQGGDYLLSTRDLWRWLEDREPRVGPRRRQRPAS